LETDTMTLRLLFPLLAVAALLAGCETAGTTSCAQQGYVAGTAEYSACVQSQARTHRYVNRAYGNCGHCMGNAGR
jgi:uncharacterized lipoprotein YajG